ncbi:MAG TPA: metallophosphoesterase [Dehalococcoidia bacterium]|nr:metallophosphoesterase [Dehalococcoidia bacterium]
MRPQVVAILCGDIHLSLSPPLARAKEKDWLEAQARPLKQLRKLKREYDVPILCAGDIFDRWNSPPELINWALDNVPKMYTIPGQHDLPTHNYGLMHKSAYWTMAMAANKDKGIHDLEPNENHLLRGIHLEAFPWGHSLTPPQSSKKGQLKVALVHQYVWIIGATYPGAPMDAMLRGGMKEMKGWDVIVFGDNHKGFLTTKGKTTIFNCGGFQRRKSDEIGSKPQVGLLYDDGSVKAYLLDTSKDVIEETSTALEVHEDMGLEEFLEELTKLQESQLDFEEAMRQLLRERKPGTLVCKLILEAMK